MLLPAIAIAIAAAALFLVWRSMIGLGIALQHLSPRVTLLMFAFIVVLGILAAAPALVRPPDANPVLTSS